MIIHQFFFPYQTLPYFTILRIALLYLTCALRYITSFFSLFNFHCLTVLCYFTSSVLTVDSDTMGDVTNHSFHPAFISSSVLWFTLTYFIFRYFTSQRSKLCHNETVPPRGGATARLCHNEVVQIWPPLDNFNDANISRFRKRKDALKMAIYLAVHRTAHVVRRVDRRGRTRKNSA